MAAILVMAAIGAWTIGTHRVSYVITHGVSMNPVYYSGDLVIVARADSYKVGEIAAYTGAGGVEVLHRIIGGDDTTGFTFKGDNNQSTDVPHPTADEIKGRAVFHVSGGGTWLRPFLSPTALGMLGFLLISGGGSASAKKRRDLARGRRKKKVKGMAGQGGSWAAATVAFKTVSRLHPILRVIAVLTTLCAACGLVLGVLGWMKPATQSTASSSVAGESITFSYSAKVEPSAAYDGTVAYSPDPIYRKLAHFVNLQLQYRGEPGRINVDARVASAAGWHSKMQLSQARQFTADRYTGTVLLDLDGLDDRVQAAATAIGTDLGQITITVTAHVEHPDGTLFEPQLPLILTEPQLALANGANSLVVNQSGKTSGGGIYPRQISVLGRDLVTAGEARRYAVWLLLFAVAGVIGIGLAAMRHVPLGNRAQVQRRYGHLLVPVEPMTSKQGEAVVTVASVPALVKLAEKYGQMILTWTRPDGADDFVVRDDGVLYRYRIVPPRPTAAKPPLSGVPHPARKAQKSAALGIASVIGSPAQNAATEAEADRKLEPESTPVAGHEIRAEQPSVTPREEPASEKPVTTPEEVSGGSREEGKAEQLGELKVATEQQEKPGPDDSREDAGEPEAADASEEPKPTAEDTEKLRTDDSQPEPTEATAAETEQPEAEATAAEIEQPKAGAEGTQPDEAKADADEIKQPEEATPEASEVTEAEKPSEPTKTAETETAKVDEAVVETPVAEVEPAPVTRTQPARRPRKRRQKVEPQPEATVEAAQATPTLAVPPVPVEVEPPTTAPEGETAATDVREKEQEAESAPGPQKRPARRAPRARKAAPPTETEAKAEAGIEAKAEPGTEAKAEAAAETPQPAKRPATRRKPAAKRATPTAPKPAEETPTPAEEAPKTTTEPEATKEPATPEVAKEPAARESDAKSDNVPAEETAASALTDVQAKTAENLATERKAAEELAERNLALEQAITRKAEEDQAAADRARAERLAKRTAERDPVFDFLPPKKD
ncbi:hypothetical protein [Actinoplanes sp. HUAS TT8]|uniref:hypothetical protein n=1 Tax=Actinoplanes sp. HUAS TT8 TaxID=3447453 RepID=UPI003F522985